MTGYQVPSRMRIAALLLAVAAAPAAAQQDGTATLTAVPDADHGAHLVGPDGRAVYAFLTDIETGGDGLSPLDSCDTACRDNWPLVTVEGEVTVGEGLYADLAGTRQVEGETVATYNDHVLFQFYRDTAGDSEGHGVYSFGGYWVLLTPSGQPIRTTPMTEKENLPDDP